ncbi:MAG: hypothetical protein ABIQ70_06735 [Dokdonella sp.]
MSARSDKLTQRLALTTERLTSLKAQQLERELRTAYVAKQRARRVELRRRLDLGKAVLTAGCGEFAMVEVVGLLLDAKERVGPSPTMRLAMRKKGQDWLAAVPPMTGGSRPLEVFARMEGPATERDPH